MDFIFFSPRLEQQSKILSCPPLLQFVKGLIPLYATVVIGYLKIILLIEFKGYFLVDKIQYYHLSKPLRFHGNLIKPVKRILFKVQYLATEIFASM